MLHIILKWKYYILEKVLNELISKALTLLDENEHRQI